MDSIINRLDSELSYKWCEYKADRLDSVGNVPFKNFVQWIDRRANLELGINSKKMPASAVGGKSTNLNAGSSNNQGQHRAIGPLGDNKSTTPAGGTNRTSEKYGLPRPPTRCPVCNQGEPHFLASCDMFQSYHNEDMWEIVGKEKVCQFCLKNSFDHKWIDCSEKRANYCPKCQKNHHAVLGCKPPPRANGGQKNTGER